MLTKVDDDKYEELSKYTWGTISNKGGYAYASRGTRKQGHYSKILMHRAIMGNPEGKMVDHVNGNTLDNRVENLRVAERNQNLQNSKLRTDSACKYKGVGRKDSKFHARIQVAPNKRIYLGTFKIQEEAAKAYDKAAIEHFGSFAKLNFKE